ncbi:MAG TPA: dethiobiotin synthase [Mycobacterium sp.]|nr:dethiobiotin synthase [Mycobacterium sp.]
MTVLIVTGTDTGVGKTVATAALASNARQTGLDVVVCKPVQTGIAAGDDDLAEVSRLTGLAGPAQLAGLARYPQPLAPVAAAEQAGLELPSRTELVRFITATDAPGRLTLVEGAGGLLVELADGVTLRDLAMELPAPVLVVVSANLGTLNHTALTLEALAARGLPCAGLIIGSWPAQPDPVHTANRAALDRLAPVRAALPAGAGAVDAAGFAAMSAAAFDRNWVSTLVA